MSLALCITTSGLPGSVLLSPGCCARTIALRTRLDCSLFMGQCVLGTSCLLFVGHELMLVLCRWIGQMLQPLCQQILHVWLFLGTTNPQPPTWTECASVPELALGLLHLCKTCPSGKGSVAQGVCLSWALWGPPVSLSCFHGDFQQKREKEREMTEGGKGDYIHTSARSLFISTTPFFLTSVFLTSSCLSLRVLKPQKCLQGRLGCKPGCDELLQAWSVGDVRQFNN